MAMGQPRMDHAEDRVLRLLAGGESADHVPRIQGGQHLLQGLRLALQRHLHPPPTALGDDGDGEQGDQGDRPHDGAAVVKEIDQLVGEDGSHSRL